MSSTSGEEISRLVAEFHETGFAVLLAAIEPTTADQLRSQMDAWFRPRPPRLAMPRQRLLPRIVERDADLSGLAASPQLLGTLEGIFGAVPQLVCSYGHEKPANTNAHTVVHSDVAHLGRATSPVHADGQGHVRADSGDGCLRGDARASRLAPDASVK